jgi:hypothetical protein
MAFTVYTQSKIAQQWVNFLEDADKYFREIETIANKPKITDKEREKVKIMLEILIEEYKTLKPSLLIGEELKLKARQQYEKAKEIYEKVFTKRN